MKNCIMSLGLFMALFMAPKAWSQAEELPKVYNNLDLAIGAGSASESTLYFSALSFQREHALLKNRRLLLGYGLRFSAFGASDQLLYTTAPYKLTKDDLIDSMLVDQPFSAALAASLHVGYLITPKLKAGFNIDALGFGFGKETTGIFTSSDNNGQYAMSQTGRPTTPSVLLIGDNDIGQLVSEFYVAYDINEKMGIRGGLNMTFVEFQSDEKLTEDNDRFRHKAILGFLAFYYRPF